MHNPGLHIEVFFKQFRDFACSVTIYTSIIISSSIIRKFFKEIHLHTILIRVQGISTIFVRQNANISCFQKSKYYANIKIFNTLPCSLKISGLSWLCHDKPEIHSGSTLL